MAMATAPTGPDTVEAPARGRRRRSASRPPIPHQNRRGIALFVVRHPSE